MKDIKIFLEAKSLTLKNPNKVYWEGWTVQDFYDELEWQLKEIMNGNSWKKIESKKELKEWIGDNQPYYKKPVPELVDYFSKLYNLK